MVVLVACLLATAVAVWAIQWSACGPIGSADAQRSGHASGGAATSANLGADTGGSTSHERVTADGGENGDAGGVRSRHVRVVAVLPDEKPAAGAEVMFWPVRTQQQCESDRKRWTDANDLEVALRATGKRVIADEHGVAEIDAEGDSDLCVCSGDHYGESSLAVDEGPAYVEHRVELQRDVTLRVQIVDRDGRSCEGITVQAEVRFASRRTFGLVEAEGLGGTDALGMLTVPHAQRVLPMPGADVVEWSLRLSCGTRRSTLCNTVGSTLAERDVSWAELISGDPIRLVVPVGGTIVVEVVDANDRPCAAEVFLDDPLSDAVQVPDEWREEYRFRQVPLGRKWSVRARGLLEEQDAPLVGPTRPDEVVRTRIQLPQRFWDIRGRVRRADGIDLYRAKFRFQANGLPNPDGYELPWLDGGAFRCWGPFPSRMTRLDDVTLLVDHELLAGTQTIAIPGTLTPGKTDLGDLTVPVPPGETVLAAVEVRCGGGVITEGTWFDVQFRKDGEWKSVPIWSRCEGEKFLLRGTPPGEPMVMCCGHATCLSCEWLPITVGASAIVELRRAAELWLSIVPPAVPREMLRAELTPLDSGDPSPAEQEWFDDNLRYCWQRLRPGRYALRIFAEQHVIHEVPVIELGSGTNIWPADGSRLDLRGRARAIFVGAKPLDGRGELNEHGLAVPAGATTLPVEYADLPVLEYWFVLREQPMDLLYAAPGFVPVRLSSPTTDTPVRMRRCTTLRVIAPQGQSVTTTVRVVVDAVSDPVLRQFDGQNPHGVSNTRDPKEPIELAYAPGTVVEVLVARNGVEGPAQRIVVGEVSPQEVVAR